MWLPAGQTPHQMCLFSVIPVEGGTVISYVQGLRPPALLGVPGKTSPAGTGARAHPSVFPRIEISWQPPPPAPALPSTGLLPASLPLEMHAEQGSQPREGAGRPAPRFLLRHLAGLERTAWVYKSGFYPTTSGLFPSRNFSDHSTGTSESPPRHVLWLMGDCGQMPGHHPPYSECNECTLR